MESFERIYLDLSKQPGKCRIVETGLGWKPPGGGDTFTLDASNMGSAQWSRAARGYEVKILSRTSGVIQLDGFEQEVRETVQLMLGSGLTGCSRTLTVSVKHSNSSTVSILKIKSMFFAAGIGARANLAKRSLLSTCRTDQRSRYHTPKSQIRISLGKTR